MAEIDVKTVSRAETGKTAPRASILASLEKALNVPVGFLGSDNAKKIQIMQSFNRKILAMNLSEDEIIRLYSEKLSIAEKQITL